MNRRGFLTAMLAAGAAPAVCKAENLMKIFVPPEKKVLTLDALAADFDGDVYMSNFQRKLANNSVVGSHVRYPRGMNGRIYHIDEFPFHLDTKHGTDDSDYFKAWTESNGNLDAMGRRLITKRNNVVASANRLNLDVQIRQIKPQAGPLEPPPAHWSAAPARFGLSVVGERKELPPNFTHLHGPCYVVRTQAGFKQALKHFNGGEKFSEVHGYPKAYPSFIVLDRHEWRDAAYVRWMHLNDFREKLSKA